MNVPQIAPEPTAIVQTQSSALMDALARAAADPLADAEKMERLMTLYERIADRQAEADFHAAMADMQPHLPIINKTGVIKNKAGGKQAGYARWEDVVEGITPIISRHGFSLTFRIRNEGDKVIVTGVLAHRGGHAERTDAPPLAADMSGSKNGVQALGSSVSYGKRYAAFALLNIVARDEDDDGRTGGNGSQFITEQQFMELRNLMDEAQADEPRFLAFLGVEHLEELPTAKLNGAFAALRRKISDRKGATNA